MGDGHGERDRRVLAFPEAAVSVEEPYRCCCVVVVRGVASAAAGMVEQRVRVERAEAEVGVTTMKE
jgi:hypothetical protein